MDEEGNKIHQDHKITNKKDNKPAQNEHQQDKE